MRLVYFLVGIWFTFTVALKQPTSYCKCICFQNSTIIPLNSPPSESSSSSTSSRSVLLSRDDDDSEGEDKQKSHHTLTCNDCNRAFCLDYNLPICKNAKEEDVFAQCFQRDSLKDRTIVTLFILATASLLFWALLKPFIVKTGVGDVVQRYTPVRAGLGMSNDDDNDGTLPRSNANNRGGGGGGGGGFGNDRSGRAGGGGRGSISRQGGLNS